MTIVQRYAGGLQLVDRRPTRRRDLKGYSAGRQAYDRRRRRSQRDRHTRVYVDILQQDPCGFCPPGVELHEQIAADHISPLERGGGDHWSNMGAACRVCNASKSNNDLLGWLLARTLAHERDQELR